MEAAEIAERFLRIPVAILARDLLKCVGDNTIQLMRER